MRKVLVIYQSRSSFVRRDIEILTKKYQVDEFELPAGSKFNVLWNILALYGKLLFSFNKYEFILTQGAGFHALPAAMLSRIKNFRFVIVAIGMDCAKIPEINYGNFRSPLLSWATSLSFRKADLILPVHESLVKKEVTYAKFKYPKQGIKNLVPNISSKIVVVHNGYDLQKWIVKKPFNQRKKTFLSVSANLNEKTFKLKGFDLVFQLAREFPNESFSLVGSYSGQLTVPKNVAFIGNMDQPALVDVYNDHRYYLQLSMSEGFPNALCEAMLCGCIPIASNIGAMPDIISSEGYILLKRDQRTLNNLIQDVLAKPSLMNPSDRIRENFPLEKREQDLLLAIKEHLK